MFLKLQHLGAVTTAPGRLLSSEELFPNPQPYSPLTQFHSAPLDPVTVTESRAQRCPSAPFNELQAAMRPPFSILCSGLNKPRDLSCFLYILSSRPFIFFHMLSHSFISSLYCVSSKLCTMFEVRLHHCRAEWDNLCLVGSTGAVASQGVFGFLSCKSTLLTCI